MNLLAEIQASIIDPNIALSTVLLKLRLLSSRLGSRALEEWVKHEMDGYPPDVELPEYRKLTVTYKGTWTGPFNSGIENAPIAPYLIMKYAGEEWLVHEMRSSIVAVDELVSHSDGATNGVCKFDAGNLSLLLQGNVYEGYACNAVTGYISTAAIREIEYAVRSRILELLIELENLVPAASEVMIGNLRGNQVDASGTVTQIFNQTIQGSFTNVTSTEASANLHINIVHSIPSR